jgi:photosystem II stability/assembly factor-like uncharacterized protein
MNALQSEGHFAHVIRAKKEANMHYFKTVFFTLTVLSAQSAMAVTDPLQIPALHTARAAKALLLGVTRAGNRLVAVGEHGVINYSDDQGNSWTQANVPVSVTLTAVQFTDAQHGWAVGHDGIVLRTVDGGQSWDKRFDGLQANTLMLADAQKNVSTLRSALDSSRGSAVHAAQLALDAGMNALADVEAGAKFGASRPLLAVYFTNPDEGYAVGAYGQLFHTADAGRSWDCLAARLHNSESLHLNAITVTTAGVVLIAGEGGLVFRSRDSGHSWQTLDSGYKGQLFGVMELDAGKSKDDTLLAYGFGGHLLMGNKDGTSWHELPSVTHKNLVGGATLADDSLLLGAQDGSLYLSVDHGQSFKTLLSGIGLDVVGFAVLEDSARVALSGTGGVHFLPISAVKVK